MYFLIFLFKVKKLFWFIYDSLILSKVEFFNVFKVSGGEIKVKVNLVMV